MLCGNSKNKRGYMKKWYECPYCKKKLLKFVKNAECNGVFLLCKKCGKEIEIKIKHNNDENSL